MTLNDTFNVSSQFLFPKKYGRSYSEMVLPNIEISGELNKSPFRDSLKSPPLLESQSLPSPFLRVTTEKTRNLMTKRSRSLSPCPAKCVCYNCNVSKLIQQSLNLSPSERSNFNTYFVRSLSHKFYNCSCYSLSSEKVQKSLHDSWQARSSLSICCSLCKNYSNSISQFRHNLSQFPEDPGIIWDKEDNQSPCKCRLLCMCKRFKGQIRQNRIVEKQNNPWNKKRSSDRVTNKWKFDSRPKIDKPIRSISCPDVGVQFNSSSTSCFLYSSCSLDSMHPFCLICSDADHKAHSSLDLEFNYQPGFICAVPSNKIFYHNCHYLKCHQSRSPKNPILKLQQQRSFSSPDTRPSIIQPDPTCTARRHRHSISGQMSYFKLLGYNVGKKLTGSANSLFSTAVISGSSSAPNLKDMVPAHASAVAGNLIF